MLFYASHVTEGRRIRTKGGLSLLTVTHFLMSFNLGAKGICYFLVSVVSKKCFLCTVLLSFLVLQNSRNVSIFPFG